MDLSTNFDRFSLKNRRLAIRRARNKETAKNESAIQKQQSAQPAQQTNQPSAATASAADIIGMQNMYFVSKASTQKSADNSVEQVQRLSEAEAIEQGYKIIKTPEDLVNMKLNKTNEKYILMGDIDLSGVNWSSKLFSGSEFNGNGYTISNLSDALFWQISNSAVIKNLNINGANSSTSANVFSETPGVLVDKIYGEEVRIENCNISNATIKIDTDDWDYSAGILAGVTHCNTLTVSNCHVTSSEIISESLSNADSRLNFAGGLLGGVQSENLIMSDCSFDGNIATNRTHESYDNNHLIGRFNGKNISLTGRGTDNTKPEIEYKFPDLIDMNQDKKDMSTAAEEQGLTESPCEGVYIKQVRSGSGYKNVAYVWNSNDKQFERSNDIKSINEDGSYVNAKGQSIDKPANEQIAARVGGYTPTVEEGTYYKDGKYYNFDETANEFIEIDKSLYEVHADAQDEVQNTQQDEVQNAAQDKVQNAPQDEVQNAAQDKVQNAPQDKVQNAPQDKVQNAAQDEVQNAPQDKVQNAAQDKVQNAPQDEVQNSTNAEVSYKSDFNSYNNNFDQYHSPFNSPFGIRLFSLNRILNFIRMLTFNAFFNRKD